MAEQQAKNNRDLLIGSSLIKAFKTIGKTIKSSFEPTSKASRLSRSSVPECCVEIAPLKGEKSALQTYHKRCKKGS